MPGGRDHGFGDRLRVAPAPFPARIAGLRAWLSGPVTTPRARTAYWCAQELAVHCVERVPEPSLQWQKRLLRKTRRRRGESGANPSLKIGLFRTILDGNKLVLALKIAKNRN